MTSSSDEPARRWQRHWWFRGAIATSSGGLLAFWASRSRFFSDSAADTQCVRQASSIAGAPDFENRWCSRRALRATYAVLEGCSPAAIAQARRSFIASDTRLRFAWMPASRNGNLPVRHSATRAGDNRPIRSSTSTAAT
jgi:hypothetical protein